MIILSQFVHVRCITKLIQKIKFQLITATVCGAFAFIFLILLIGFILKRRRTSSSIYTENRIYNILQRESKIN